MGNNISTRHVKTQLTALDVLLVLGSKQPKRGTQEDYYQQVRELAQQVPVLFQTSQEQRQQLRAVQPSPDAMTQELDPQIRESMTIAVFVVGGAWQFGNQRKITSATDQVIALGRHICQQFGISLEPASTGLREASQQLVSAQSR